MAGIDNIGNNPNITNVSNLSQAQIAKETNEIESFQEKLLMAEDDEKLKEACDQFEEYFINLMFKEMRKTVNEDKSENSMFKKSQAENIMQDFLYQEYSKNMTEAGGIGLSDAMYEQMQKQNAGKVTSEEVLGMDNTENL